MGHRSGDGRFDGRLKNHRPNFEMLDARIASALNKIISEFQL